MTTTSVMSLSIPGLAVSSPPQGDPAPQPMAHSGGRSAFSPVVGPQQTVLIAEDHEDSRDALRTLLDAFGYRVHVATNGRQAVEMARATNPDLVLMDIMMPEVDGLEATRTLRADAAFRQVPIIALTAMEGARDQVMAAGCDDFMSKPLDVRTFLDRVRTWLEAGRPAS
jgi:CheY-like chemotaxis protein